MSGFRITNAKGFHITFDNGFTVSVQFGPGDYADNYDRSWDAPPERGYESGVAETAVRGPNSKMIDRGDGNSVQAYQTVEQVMELLQWAQSQPMPTEAV